MSGRLGTTLLVAFRRDLWRIALPWAIGFVLVFTSQRFALLVGEPAFAPWGLFAGGACFVTALSHVLRRLFFPQLDLQRLAVKAMETSTGAGLVYLGACVVLAAIVLMMGSMFRT